MQEFIKTVVADDDLSAGYCVLDVKFCEYVYDFTHAITPYYNKAIKCYAVKIFTMYIFIINT